MTTPKTKPIVTPKTNPQVQPDREPNFEPGRWCPNQIEKIAPIEPE